MIEQERIEKDAHLVALQAYDYQSAYSGYIAGASAERERLKDTRLYSQEVIDSYEEQLKQERNKAIDAFYKLMNDELQIEPINRARYMIRLSQIKESLKNETI